MIAREQHNVMEKEKFYHSSFNDEEQLDFKQALGVVGFKEEVALIRVKIKYILKNSPSNITLLLRAIGSLETLVRLQQRDKNDSLDRIQKLMDTEFKGCITPGKPVTGNLRLMAESTRTQSRKLVPSNGGTPTVTNPPCSDRGSSPSPCTEKEPELVPDSNRVSEVLVTPESVNSPTLCTESLDRYGMLHVEDADEKPLDVSIDESASNRNRQGPGGEVDVFKAESASIGNRQGLGSEVTPTPPVSPERPVPHFQHSNSLFHRKKHHKKR